MIDDFRKVVYFHPTRTGGSSVELMLSNGRCALIHEQQHLLPSFGFRFWGGSSQHYTRTEMGEVPEGYTAFATVRNPYHRAASIKAYNGGGSLMDILSRWPNNAILQTEYATGVHYVVRMCDGESANLAWLEQMTGQKLVHTNGRPPQKLTKEEVDFVRRHYGSDFEHLGYDAGVVPPKLLS